MRYMVHHKKSSWNNDYIILDCFVRKMKLLYVRGCGLVADETADEFYWMNNV